MGGLALSRVGPLHLPPSSAAYIHQAFVELQKPEAWGDTIEERGILVGIPHPSFGYQG